MLRNIIKIDESLCVGCGLCANACHEGAIGIIDGKAKLLKDDYCDGLGNCLPVCPTNAISFEKREAVPFNREIAPKRVAASKPSNSQLRQWPVQIQLLPIQAPYFDNANILIAADCCAFSYANFHQDFMQNRVTMIGCPKLDDVAYEEKLTEILKNNSIQSISVLRMEVPCCGGIEHAARTALKNSGKHLPFQVVILSTQGEIIEK